MLEDIEKYVFHVVLLPAPFCFVSFFLLQRRRSHCWRFKFDDLLGYFDIFPYWNYDLLGTSYSAGLHLPRLFLVFLGRIL
jgi:hypothetical protein